MYDGPIREGSRGGRDQFSWESVKGDKDREFYLGHSVKALVGHWQKNKDPYWYTKGKSGHDAKLAEEVKAVKEREEELMLEALGIKKPKKKQTADIGNRLQPYEVEELLKRREKEEGEQQESEDAGPKGLGFQRKAVGLAATATHEVLEGVGLTQPSQEPPPKRKNEGQMPEDEKKRKKSERKEKKEAKRRRKEEFATLSKSANRHREKPLREERHSKEDSRSRHSRSHSRQERRRD